MTYTPEELRQCALAIEAKERKEPVEQMHPTATDGEWEPLGGLGIIFINDWRYRPKTAPKTRPWSKPDDVPGPVCWIRDGTRWGMAMVIRISPDGVAMWESTDAIVEMWSWRELEFSDSEYSTDRREWKKCEVAE